MATSKEKPGSKSNGAMKPSVSKSKELKTEGPLSEKDEVKNAEHALGKSVKKNA